MPHLRFETALGLCWLGWSEQGITTFRFLGGGEADVVHGLCPGTTWGSKGGRRASLGERAVPPFKAEGEDLAPGWVRAAVTLLREHLAGRPAEVSALPLDASGSTPFQLAVAKVLRATRPGESLTYGDVAFRLGRPGAARAVGRAVAANPLLLLVPCHRVVGAKGPGGWSAFGSPAIKARLLDLERPDTDADAAPLS